MKMSRRFDKEALATTFELRGRILSALTPNSDTELVQERGELRKLVSEMKAAARKSAGLPESQALMLMAKAVAASYYLLKWLAETRRATPGVERFLGAARARASELQGLLSAFAEFPQFQRGLSEWAAEALSVSEPQAVRAVLSRLAAVPVPVLYSVDYDPYGRPRRKRREDAADDAGGRGAVQPPPLVKLSFAIDGVEFATPQAIRSRVQFGLHLRAEAIQCPPDQRLLEIDFVTTMAPEDYGLSKFVLEMPGRDPRVSAEGDGHLIIRASQSDMSDPAHFTARARFVNEDRSAATPAIVIGLYELRLRALDQDSYQVLSLYPSVDIQIPKILNDVRAALPDLQPSDFRDFQQCLVYLGRYCGMVQQSGVFRGKARVDEKREFQQHLLGHLRMALGPDVREAEAVGGGTLDLVFRNIVVELKVEYGVKDRVALRKKYIDQPTQYAASSIPLGITCILDMTEKTNPPANIANNITLETPTLHGFENGTPNYPTKVAVVIIDGNLKLPSDYS
jgi:hypothetical protein